MSGLRLGFRPVAKVIHIKIFILYSEGDLREKYHAALRSYGVRLRLVYPYGVQLYEMQTPYGTISCEDKNTSKCLDLNRAIPNRDS